tara:strand:- start:49 stop:435 length:387 start_codon:yes stop_codon:yes gene_type:complete
MQHDFSPKPTAPSPLCLPIAVARQQPFNYYFIIKKRSFWCYKKYIKLELDCDYYYIEYFNGNLQIPKTKSKEYIIDILKTIGISNKHIFKVYVMNGQTLMSSKYFYDLNSIINFVNKTELIMENVKHV